MNVFVLCTGRCGSTTFARACAHITNFTASHESRCRLLGPDRVAYPENHIEVDNRLAWFLGRLGNAYGDDAFYVHLLRDRAGTAASYNQRWFPAGILAAYNQSILMRHSGGLEVAEDLWDTVNENIRAFLADKSQTLEFQLDTAEADMRKFWQAIGAEGDLEAAVAEWRVRHNASKRS